MSRQRTKAVVARVEEEIGLAQAAAQRVLTASANFSQTTNPGVLGPAVTVQFDAPVFATKVGTTVRVNAIVTGLASNTGDPVSLSILKDGVPIATIPIPTMNAGPLFSLNEETVDTVVQGVPHVYSARINNAGGGGHTVTIEPVSVMLTIEERPAP
jgi:hypothetical protein